MVKSIRSLTTNICAPCHPDQVIEHVMYSLEQVPLKHPMKASEIRCPRCGGSQGFYIPHLKTWSCSSLDCIDFNAGKDKVSQEKFAPRLSLSACGVTGEDYEAASMQKCNQDPAILKYLLEYSSAPRGFVVLAGNNGTGKTYAACAVLREILNKGCQSARFIRMADLYLLWLDNKTQGQSEVNFVERFCSYEVLVLDDLGSRTPSEAFLDVFYIIVDKRKAQEMPTIFTTNLTSEQFKAKFGEALYSRIVSGAAVKFSGEDRRMEVKF